MRYRRYLRIPKITTLAISALLAAGCGTDTASNELSTDSNLAEDAVADDVLGDGNMQAANETVVNQ